MRKRNRRPVDPDSLPGAKRPKREVGAPQHLPLAAPPAREEDPDLWKVYDALTRTPGAIDLIGETIRDTFDQIYDGQWTGRWDYRQLNKTEKTHVGTLIQINMQKELNLTDGDDLDYKIAGVEVDCKWSMTFGGWEIPREMWEKQGPQIALVIWGNDYTSRWLAGLVRTEEQHLKPIGKQRDGKRRLNDQGLDRILWLQNGGDLLPNALLALDPATRAVILGSSSGQECVNRLFRAMQGQLVDRATVVTVAMQADSPKRVREARKLLAPEGIVIFGHYAPQPAFARALGLPEPTMGSFVSARLAPATSPAEDGVIEVQGTAWKLAGPDDPVVFAPTLPKQGREVEPPPVEVL